MSGVRFDDTHSVEWDLEGWGKCCSDYMEMVASAPDLLRERNELRRQQAAWLEERAKWASLVNDLALIIVGAAVPGSCVNSNDLDTANDALDRAIPLLDPSVPGFDE